MSSHKAHTIMLLIRELMDADMDSKLKLDEILKSLATGLGCDLCKIYLIDGNKLSLFAGFGINADLSSKFYFPLNVGTVGRAARTATLVNVSNIRQDPDYYNMPEMDESNFNGLVGVPMMFSGKCIGVLVALKRSATKFSFEETEALRNISTVLSQWINANKSINNLVAPQPDKKPLRVSANSISDGASLGVAVLHRPRLTPLKTIADDTVDERNKLEAAMSAMRKEVDNMLIHPTLLRDDDHREMIEAYRMFANDRGWLRSIEMGISSGLTAEASVMAAGEQARTRIKQIADPILRERMHDLDDLAQRLMHHLRGIPITFDKELPDNSVLISRSMGSASLLEYDRNKIAGIVLADGGRGSHIALLARGFEIPAVSDAAAIVEEAEEGEDIVVNGSAGIIYLRPPEIIINGYNEKINLLKQRRDKMHAFRHKPAMTQDNHKINVKLNCGLLVDVEDFADTGADSVGLFRTEILFLTASHLPTVTEQKQGYSAIYNKLGDIPVHFRTVDVGGDKVLPYLRKIDQPNPALGWRALRLALDRPGLLRHQLRALLEAVNGKDLAVMFPMISEPGEFIKARDYLDIELERHLKGGGKPPKSLSLGAMIEVPSVVWSMPDLLPMVDFISVGTNDLFQFYYAADRDNSMVNGRYDPLEISGLRILKMILNEARKQNVKVDLCGDMACDVVSAMALLGLGYDTLSIPARSIGLIKHMTRQINLEKLQFIVSDALENGKSDLRQSLSEYAASQGITISDENVDDLSL